MIWYKCNTCHKKYPTDTNSWKCSCGGLFDLDFRVEFDKSKIDQGNHSLWRYRAFLPQLNTEMQQSFEEGYTPLLKDEWAGIEVHLKMEYLNPTGSFKDRGSSLLVSHIKNLGMKELVEDSSGNAGASMATYAVRAGIKPVIIVPESASGPKLRQIESTGAKIIKVEGTREKVAEKAVELAAKMFYASHVYNPFFLQGTKTIAYEIAEQLGWNAPDAVVLPVGNGSLLIGAYLGFQEMYSAGAINKIPKLIAVQAKNCCPLYHYKMNESARFITLPTIAEGIAVAKPARAAQVIDAINNSGGYVYCADEEEIKAAWKQSASKGFYIEYTSAAALAALPQIGKREDNEVLIVILTGNGLKTSHVANV